MVLQDSPHLWPADAAASPGRPLQLCRWLRQLASWLERTKKGVVLSRAWKGLPESRWRLRDRRFGTIRLQRRVCELDGWLVSSKESLVLFQQGQGLPSSCWRMRMKGMICACR